MKPNKSPFPCETSITNLLPKLDVPSKRTTRHHIFLATDLPNFKFTRVSTVIMSGNKVLGNQPRIDMEDKINNVQIWSITIPIENADLEFIEDKLLISLEFNGTINGSEVKLTLCLPPAQKKWIQIQSMEPFHFLTYNINCDGGISLATKHMSALVELVNWSFTHKNKFGHELPELMTKHLISFANEKCFYTMPASAGVYDLLWEIESHKDNPERVAVLFLLLHSLDWNEKGLNWKQINDALAAKGHLFRIAIKFLSKGNPNLTLLENAFWKIITELCINVVKSKNSTSFLLSVFKSNDSEDPSVRTDNFEAYLQDNCLPIFQKMIEQEPGLPAEGIIAFARFLPAFNIEVFDKMKSVVNFVELLKCAVRRPGGFGLTVQQLRVKLEILLSIQKPLQNNEVNREGICVMVDVSQMDAFVIDRIFNQNQFKLFCKEVISKSWILQDEFLAAVQTYLKLCKINSGFTIAYLLEKSDTAPKAMELIEWILPHCVGDPTFREGLIEALRKFRSFEPDKFRQFIHKYVDITENVNPLRSKNEIKSDQSNPQKAVFNFIDLCDIEGVTLYTLTNGFLNQLLEAITTPEQAEAFLSFLLAANTPNKNDSLKKISDYLVLNYGPLFKQKPFFEQYFMSNFHKYIQIEDPVAWARSMIVNNYKEDVELTIFFCQKGRPDSPKIASLRDAIGAEFARWGQIQVSRQELNKLRNVSTDVKDRLRILSNIIAPRDNSFELLLLKLQDYEKFSAFLQGVCNRHCSSCTDKASFLNYFDISAIAEDPPVSVLFESPIFQIYRDHKTLLDEFVLSFQDFEEAYQTCRSLTVTKERIQFMFEFVLKFDQKVSELKSSSENITLGQLKEVCGTLPVGKIRSLLEKQAIYGSQNILISCAMEILENKKLISNALKLIAILIENVGIEFEKSSEKLQLIKDWFNTDLDHLLISECGDLKERLWVHLGEISSVFQIVYSLEKFILRRDILKFFLMAGAYEPRLQYAAQHNPRYSNQSDNVNSLKQINLLFNDLKKEGVYPNLAKFWDKMDDLIHTKPQLNGVMLSLAQLVTNFSEFNTFFYEALNMYEAKMKSLDAMLTNSSTIVTLTPEGLKFTVTAEFTTPGEMDTKEFYFNYFVEIRDEILMKATLKSTRSDDNDDASNLIQRFMQFFELLSYLNTSVLNLRTFELESPEDDLNSSTSSLKLEFEISGGNFNLLADLTDHVVAAWNKKNLEISNSYRMGYFFTLLHGNMFKKVQKILLTQTPSPDTERYETHLMRFLGIEDTNSLRKIVKDFFFTDDLQRRSSRFFWERLSPDAKLICSYFGERRTMDFNQFPVEVAAALSHLAGFANIQEFPVQLIDRLNEASRSEDGILPVLLNHRFSKISDLIKPIGQELFVPLDPRFLYSQACQTDKVGNLCETLLRTSLATCGGFPSHDQILFCSKDTNYHKLRAFLSRMTNTEVPRPYWLVFPERLKEELQQEFYEQISIMDQTITRTCPCIILYCRTNSIIINSIMDHPGHRALNVTIQKLKANPNFEELYKHELESIKKKVWIAKSKAPLTGKSHKIRELVQAENLHYRFLKLTGPVDARVAMTNLLDQMFVSQTALHIEMGQIDRDRESFLTEWLFSLIFLNVLEIGTDVVALPADIRYFIEFDSSMFDRLWKRLELVQGSFEITIHEPGFDPAPVHAKQRLCEQFVLATKQGKVKEWLNIRLEEGEAAENRFFDRLMGPNGTAYHEILIAEGIKNDDMRSRAKVVIFETMITFLAECFLRCAFITIPDQNISKMDPQIAAESVINSVKKLSEIAMGKIQEIGAQQEQWAFELERAEDQSVAASQMSAVQVALPQAALPQPADSSWSNDIPFMIVFANDFPILIYREPSDIPAKLLPNVILDSFISTHKATHEGLFFYLAQLNTRLSVSQFCDMCNRVFHRSSCMDCGSPLITAQSFADTHPVPPDFPADRVPGSPASSSDKALWMVEWIAKILNLNSRQKFYLQTKITTMYDEYCMKCRVVARPTFMCLQCQDIPGLLSSEKQAILSAPRANKETRWCSRICNALTPQVRICLKCNKLTELSDATVLQDRQFVPWYKRFFYFFGRPWKSDLSANIEVFDKLAKTIRKRYVLTRDNFMKMLYIYVRAKARTPVILMGETGCGKTSLVKFLCQDILDDYFEQVNVHSGTEEPEILESVRKFLKVCRTFPDRDCWLTFDEFNTSPATGLIKTIMADRMIGNEKVSDNAIFVATCNPLKIQREISEDMKDVGLPIRAGSPALRLTYHVNPIPDTLLLFTFNFGHLSERDENQYISTIIQREVGDSFPDWVGSAILNMHRVVKERFDLSATSLRDVRRFLKLSKWFETVYFAPSLRPDRQVKRAFFSSVLAMILCYYYRLPEGEGRLQIISHISHDSGLSVIEIENLIHSEQTYVLNQLELGPGIVRNNALGENVFSLFCCIMNKIPIVVVGKPGSSKSLSLQLVLEATKGQNSRNEFLRNFPELSPVDYQGSEHSLSADIVKAFNMAENVVRNQGPNVIPVLLFDEIGLAERSKNNPLKVLHSKLEVDQVDIGFVGLSNWFLDASKMNRVLVVLRKDPPLEELIQTAIQMGRSLINGPMPSILEVALRAIAEAYQRVKSDPTCQDQSSLRDFYALIKYIAGNFQFEIENATSEAEITKILSKSIFVAMKRNFSSHPNLFQKMSLAFQNAVEQSRNFILPPISEISKVDLIVSNLQDPRARYLLLIIRQPRVHQLVYDLIQSVTAKRQNMAFHVMIRSPFPADMDSEEYALELVWEITLAIEAGVTLVMHDLGDIYASFYDLFNQSFQRFGDTLCCKVVQGSATKGFYVVHPNFKAIVFASEKEFERTDEALKSRFEKYPLEERDFMTKDQIGIVERANAFLMKIFAQKSANFVDTFSKIVANYNEDCLSKWLAEAGPEVDLNDDAQLKAHLLGVLKRVANLNICQFLQDNPVIQNWKEVLDNVIAIKNLTIVDLIRQRVDLPKTTLTVVYTFSSVLYALRKKIAECEGKHLNSSEFGSVDDLSQSQNFDLAANPHSLSEVCQEINLHVVHDQKQLRKLLKSFCQNPNRKVLVVRVKGQEQANHMYYLQNIINQELRKCTDVVKHAIIVIHYREDNVASCSKFPLGMEWTEYFLDDLFYPISSEMMDLLADPSVAKAINYYEGEAVRSFDFLLDNSNHPNLVRESPIINKANQLSVDMDISQTNDVTNQTLLPAASQIFDPMTSFSPTLATFLMGLCRDSLLATFQAQKMTIYNLLSQYPSLYSESLEFLNKIKFVLRDSYQKKLNLILDEMERLGLLPSARLFFKNLKNQRLENVWLEIVTPVLKSVDYSATQRSPVDHRLVAVQFPLSQREFNALTSYQMAHEDEARDLQNEWNEQRANDYMDSFSETSSVYKGLSLSPYQNSECLPILLPDMVQQACVEEDVEKVPISSLADALSGIPFAAQQHLFKLLCFDPTLIWSFGFLAGIFYEILKEAHQRYVECYDQPLDELFISNVTNNLVNLAMSPDIFVKHWDYLANLFPQYESLIDTIEGYTGPVHAWKQLKMWLRLATLLRSLNAAATPSLMTQIITSQGDNLIDIQSRPERFQVWVDAIKTSVKAAGIHQNVSAALTKFLFIVLEIVAEDCIDDPNKHPTLCQILSDKFAEIDNSPDLYLYANRLTQYLVRFTKLKAHFEAFLIRNEYISTGLTSNATMPTQDQLHLKDWLEELLRINQKYLPFILINSMELFIDECIGKFPEKVKQLTDERFVRRSIDLFESLDPAAPLSIEPIFRLAALKFTIKQYPALLTNPERVSALMRMNEFLNQQFSKSKTLQILTLKTLKTARGLNLVTLRNELAAHGHAWMRHYIGELTRIQDQRLSEVRLIGATEFSIAEQKLDDASHDTNGFGNLLDWLNTNRSSKTLLSFYHAFINRYYLERERRDREIANLTRHITVNKHRIKQILGGLGTELVSKLIAGFKDGGLLRRDEGMGQDDLQLRLIVLHAFAVFVSQKYEENPISDIIFKNTDDVNNLAVSISSKYLPGMLLPDKLEFNFMISLKKHLEKIESKNWFQRIFNRQPSVYKCSEDCDYFFVFEDCGKPNLNPGVKCPVCKVRDLGGLRLGVAQDYQIEMSGSVALTKIQEKIRRFLGNYCPGYFNSDLTFKTANKYELNVDFRTTILLNLLTNGFLFVANNLGLLRLESVMEHEDNENLAENLWKKIAEATTLLKEQFDPQIADDIPHVLMAKIGQNLLSPGTLPSVWAYFDYEQDIEQQVLGPLYRDPITEVSLAQRLARRPEPTHINTELPMLLNEEMQPSDGFPMLTVLRVSNKRVSYQDFKTAFLT